MFDKLLLHLVILSTLNGGFADNWGVLARDVPTWWQIEGTGDFNGDGRDDILWRDTNGTITNWLGTANGGFANNDANAFTSVPSIWHVQPEHPLV